ncbi:hypothetical protein H4696_009792 [Amycolatopsis lexingtonensis]|uniref:DUF4145 domain-containing protein n=1 Tax=Amycolatopsis lexingtonensis TaxID=218822 RepID=A0ABR9IHM9_9PSEU|nr:hypothetical protein [Amycolatopsis lexingtonensis]MBE1502692.1 hypothetical protein [Amycolatopsis lexingtonensis]
MEFTSSVIGSLAWPACVLLIVLALRRALTKMLASGPLKALKAGPSGFELEFDRTLTDAQINAGIPADKPKDGRTLIKTFGHPDKPTPHIGAEAAAGDMRQLAALAPAAAILESFGRLEKTLRDRLEPIIGEPRNLAPVRKIAVAALDLGILTDAELRSLFELATLRDALSHGEGRDVVDLDRALAYIEVSDKLINRVENADVSELAAGPAQSPAPGNQPKP